MVFDRANAKQLKQQVQRSFNATSPTYSSAGDFHWQFAERLVERAPLAAGETVLDVATGTAPAALMAAQVVGARGLVVGIDLSPGIVALAKRNIEAAAVPNIEVAVGDAEQLPFPAAGFDGVLCSSAIVWFPDILRALREAYRVLRPRRWIAFSCFGGPARQTINDLLIKLLKPYGIQYPELNTPLNSPAKCRQMVHGAGFRDIAVQTANEQQFPLDPEALFQRAWASGTRFNVTLPPADLAQVKARYLAEVADLLRSQAEWNHDYEQFVVAYKPR